MVVSDGDKIEPEKCLTLEVVLFLPADWIILEWATSLTPSPTSEKVIHLGLKTGLEFPEGVQINKRQWKVWTRTLIINSFS